MTNETFAEFLERMHHSHTTFEELASLYFELKAQNREMKNVLKVIWDADALANWALEDCPGEDSIADMLRAQL